MNLLSHVRGDGDLLGAWFEHYRRLGVTTFHLIVHGPRSDNAVLYRLAETLPVRIHEEYDTEFSVEEKGRRMNRVLATLPPGWMLVVDSDEFVELPYRDTARTIRVLERLGMTVLFAPFLHRLAEGGSLETPETIADPFEALPLCSSSLHADMGVVTCEWKYPLFRNGPGTVVDAGNHGPPNRRTRLLAAPRGVTHHFKWRRSVLERLNSRANSAHKFRHESVGFLEYLEANGRRLPTANTFRYSRRELVRRGLLLRAGPVEYARVAWAASKWLLPGQVRETVRRLTRLAARGAVSKRLDG
jgi:hypothetical protein